MNRPYTIERFQEKLKQIRFHIPTISISSDLILGFPDETELDFEETLETLKQFNFSFLHIFPYSKRDGTKAEELSNHLPNSIKKERCAIVSKLSQEQYLSYMSNFLHTEVEVLFETQKDEYMLGHNDEYVEVKVKTNQKEWLNTIQKVQIIDVVDHVLIGEIRG